ncbi:MAG: ThuA domain-containing protein [Candidatus Binatia bacterium]|nr:ThuA domain-containing protein [Candidatus Binatia bacterium]
MATSPMKSILKIVGAIVLVAIVFVGWQAYKRIGPALGWVDPVIDTVPPELPATLNDSSVKILLFSKTSGFRHEEAIPAAEASLGRLAERNGWAVFQTENAAVFNDEQLSRFDVIVGNNTTGDNWTDEQKAAFIGWIEDGGGFVGLHGAAGTRYRYWNWYTDDLLGGGRFTGHPMMPQFREATVVIEDGDHPIMAHFGESFVHTDEWYSFEESARESGSHVLATLDESTYDPGEELQMGDHPIIWIACPGNGRSFYSALGHGAKTYMRSEHERMLEASITWAAGDSCP